jgi:hypothetical protein
VIYADATLFSRNMQSAPGHRPTIVPAADAPMASDSSQIALLPYFVLGLVLVCAGLGWAWSRWTTWQIWLVGLPAVIAMLWLATSSAMLLLPNLS